MVVGLVVAFVTAAATAATSAGATTSTTLPGPAPNQSQINATQSQVSQIEATLAQEEQQTSILDDKYNTAEQNLQNAQTRLQAIAANLEHATSAVDADRRLVAADAVQAYVYGTPETGFASYFSSSATMNEARNQYTNQIVGNLTKDETSLLQSETQLEVAEGSAAGRGGAGPVARRRRPSRSPQANEQEAATTKATLNQVQGQLAQEVAAAAIQEAKQEAAAAAAARSAAAQQQAAAAAATAATVAGAVGGSSARGCGDDGREPGRRRHRAGRRIRRRAGAQGWPPCRRRCPSWACPTSSAGEQPGVGFDCSGLVQWAWGKAGVSIPRTTETEWPALSHVSLDALQPGDLLFYYNLDGDSQVDHVVMYAGSGPYGTRHGDSGTLHGIDRVVLPHLHRRPHRGSPPVARAARMPSTGRSVRWSDGQRAPGRRREEPIDSRRADPRRLRATWMRPRIPGCPTSTNGVAPNGRGHWPVRSTSPSTRSGSARSGKVSRRSRPRVARCSSPTMPAPSPPTHRSSCTGSRRSSGDPCTDWPTTSSGRCRSSGPCGRAPAGSRPVPPTPTGC